MNKNLIECEEESILENAIDDINDTIIHNMKQQVETMEDATKRDKSIIINKALKLWEDLSVGWQL